MRSGYSIAIATEGAAFAEDPGREVARILRELADRCERSGLEDRVALTDANGNRVGSAIRVDG